MNKKVAILQSNYIPWKGYFDIINMVDSFVFHDDLQYTKQDWRNRNKIKTPNGPTWLTIPCGTNDKRLICEVELSDKSWQRKHWNCISSYYQAARWFSYYRPFFEDFYLSKHWKNLSDLNQYLVKNISSEILMSDTTFDDSRNYDLKQKKNEERLLELLFKTAATHYLSGPAAKTYLHAEHFQQAGIDLEWMDYSDYPEYNQLYPPFEHRVSILDLIFNEGSNARRFMKSFRTDGKMGTELANTAKPTQ